MSDAAPGRHVGRREDVAPGERPEGDRGEHVRDPARPTEPTFPHTSFLRTGYDRAAVDAFVTKVVLAVHDERQTSVTADEVARARFPGRRFGPGYRMQEVDDYLGAVEALLRRRATARGASPEPAPTDAERAHRRQHGHHPTWWIYGVAALLVVVIVAFTMTQT